MADPGSIASQLPPGDDWATRKIQDLEREVKELGPSIAASFNSTIASLNVAIANAAAAAANQVSPATNAGSASSFVLSSSFAALVSFNLTVPTGYTRALITVSGSVASLSTYASSDAVHAFTSVAGNNGAEAVSYFYGPNSGGSATCFQTISFSGLVGGAAVGVILYGRLTTGPGPSGGLATLAVASLVAQAIFLK
jgi:hypothetical protein